MFSKRFYRLILGLLIFTFLLFFIATTPTTAITLGDLNNDGAINILDVTLAMQHVLGIINLTDSQLPAADVNGDGTINILDVTLIMQRALGMIDKFPYEIPDDEVQDDPAKEHIFAGTYLVSTDIAPGRYRSNGNITYWERLSGLGGEFDDIIANGAFHSGSVYVDIAPTDTAFSFTGGGSFYRIDDSYQGKLKTTFGNGMYLVGKDIKPGRYRSDGGIDYWERLSGLSGELKDIMANEASLLGIAYVDISPSDEAFSFSGSGNFYLVDDSFEGELKTSFGDGTYWVGKDIEPGRYRSADGASYWARLKSFSGEFSDIIANEAFAEGSVIVEISSSDVGFETRGAQWEKID